MLSPAVSADRRFRRAHVRPLRRRRWRRLVWRVAKVTFVLGLVGYGGVRTAALLRQTPLLQIRRIVVRGAERLSPGEVLALVSDLEGQNILRADLAASRARLLGSPWVADAALSRLLPSTVEIRISERRPIALARLATRLFLVDASGVVIDEYGPQHRDLDLPIVDGVAPRSDGRAAVLDPERMALAARLLRALQAWPALAGRISIVDVHDVRNAMVLLEGDPAWLYLGTDRFVERLQRYLDVLPALRARVPALDYVDLRFGDRVFVRPARPGDAPAASAGEPADRAGSAPGRF